jgi:ribosome-associated toxin RatA of RatAB toxin-antitoxin module
MTEQATQHLVIQATPQRCLAVAMDFERYPIWASDVKDATVLTRDDEGRGSEVEYRAAAMGRSTTYTLRYNYGSNPLRMSWRLLRGDLMLRLDGEYEFAPLADDPDSTEVTYYLAVDPAVVLPGFVKRRAEARIMHNALQQLKGAVETGTGS